MFVNGFEIIVIFKSASGRRLNLDSRRAEAWFKILFPRCFVKFHHTTKRGVCLPLSNSLLFVPPFPFLCPVFCRPLLASFLLCPHLLSPHFFSPVLSFPLSIARPLSHLGMQLTPRCNASAETYTPPKFTLLALSTSLHPLCRNTPSPLCPGNASFSSLTSAAHSPPALPSNAPRLGCGSTIYVFTVVLSHASLIGERVRPLDPSQEAAATLVMFLP